MSKRNYTHIKELLPTIHTMVTEGMNLINKLWRTPCCPFVLFVGTKKLVKGKEFEQFISRH